MQCNAKSLMQCSAIKAIIKKNVVKNILVAVLLFAHVKRFSVSQMQDSFLINHFFLCAALFEPLLTTFKAVAA